MDAVKTELTSIEATATESGAAYADLLERQEAAVSQASSGPGVDLQRRPPEAECGSKAGSAADSTIRVDVGLLDKLMSLVDELALARNQVLRFSARQHDTSFHATSQRLDWITTELQASVLKTRRQPIGTIWNKLPRLVRDLATACGKQDRTGMVRRGHRDRQDYPRSHPGSAHPYCPQRLRPRNRDPRQAPAGR